MKILIASDCFVPRWDGIARFLLEILPRIKDEFEITVAAPRFSGKLKRIPGIKIRYIRTFQFTIGDYKPSKPHIRTLNKLVNDSDIIFSQTIGPIGALAILLANRQEKKVVSYIHSLEWDLFVHSISIPKRFRPKLRNIAKGIVSHIYNRCNLLLVPSKDIEKELTRIGVRTQKTIITLGTDTKKFSPKNKELARKKTNLKGFIVGYCGRIGREKDLPTLYKAIKIVSKNHKIKLLIVGDGLRKIIKKFDKKLINYVGPKDDVVPYLCSMDIFVLPSLTETSSLATMEAMSCGLPVITTRVGYVKKYVKNKFNGLTFQKQNYKSLAKKIIYLKNHPELRKELGKNARKTMLNYDWEKTSESIISVLKALKS